MTRRKAPAKHIDWFQVITALSRKGYSVQALADELMVARTPSSVGAKVQNCRIRAAIAC